MKLEISNLQYSAGRLQMEIDITFDGRISGLFGPSGAGKTVLLELIAGFRKPKSGSIRFNNTTLTDLQNGIFVPTHLRRIGYVPQDLALFPHLSVEANIAYGYKGKDLAGEKIVHTLELQSLLHRSTKYLSGGEKQRVAFARAVLASPDLLLLDEPLAGLNEELKSRVKEFLLRIRDEFPIPMVFVSHDADDVVALCDQVIVLHNGRNIRAGKPQELFIPDHQTHYVIEHS